MLFWKKKAPPLVQSTTSAWKEQWRAIVPPECRNVPITVDGIVGGTLASKGTVVKITVRYLDGTA